MFELSKFAAMFVHNWMLAHGVHPATGLKYEVMPEGWFLVLTIRELNQSIVLEQGHWRFRQEILN